MRVIVGDVLSAAFIDPHVEIQIDRKNHVILERRNHAFLRVPFYGASRVAPAAFVEFPHAEEDPFRMFEYVFGSYQVPVINQRILEKARRICARKDRLDLRPGRVAWIDSLASEIVGQDSFLKPFQQTKGGQRIYRLFPACKLIVPSGLQAFAGRVASILRHIGRVCKGLTDYL